MSIPIEIRPARLPQDLPIVRTLFRDYADSLDIDLGFQDFEAELSALPGKYEAPAGRILLAWRGGQAVGCIALRPLQDGGCEMKRLFVRPDMRGERLGRRLAERLCQEAREAGYTRIYLDTLPTMAAAVALYTALGFEPAEAYVFNPIPGALFFKREL
ncbi:GNAT family N-acetyltransferase [Pollutimonas sp. M17]|uniref:GNAT family N-acetyltransferase n=1 Tax=Pollutimonas sp. M17 TaxID=2962065 RepID=UPI0021F4B7A4|nr:GNAT family N-acetyltransferase [Pollutimonas sp. M17]UYO95243.1 GNAT family N-acetyltransferase [Pollutimonas sp. M17]